MGEKLLRTKYAAELAVVDLGADITLRWVKRYRYRGEQREKVIEMSRPYSLGAVNIYTSQITLTYDTSSGYYASTALLPLDAKIAVFERE